MLEARLAEAHSATSQQPALPDDATRLNVVSAAEHMALIAEVKALADHIDAMRQEVAELAANEAVSSHVSVATDELDAVVVHTAEATGKILDVCETLDAAHLPDCGHIVAAATARIYEACSFQDVTGQRVAKVVQTLQALESKIAQILRVFDRPPAGEVTHACVVPPANPLLNGPQHPTRAMDQGAVDALLDFDR